MESKIQENAKELAGVIDKATERDENSIKALQNDLFARTTIEEHINENFKERAERVYGTQDYEKTK